MSATGFDPNLRFIRVDGVSLYPWWRKSSHHGRAAFWVSDGSNHMEHATAVESLEDLIEEVFSKGRSVWLRPEKFVEGGGLYRMGEQAVTGWDAAPEWASRIEAALRNGNRTFPRVIRREVPTTEKLLAALQAKLANVGDTERTAIVRQRIGQALYREAQCLLWEGRCAATGLALEPVLRASHAKPWSRCASPAEQLDPYNGFLLAPHIDALFDKGFLSFDATGTVIWSECLASEERGRLGLPEELRIRGIDPRHDSYLTYHREEVLRRHSGADNGTTA